MGICGRFLLCLVLLASACSLPPERKVTLEQLQRSNIAYYVVKDDMESILEELNRNGEVVVEAEYYQETVFIKIYVTSNGIVVERFYSKGR